MESSSSIDKGEACRLPNMTADYFSRLLLDRNHR